MEAVVYRLCLSGLLLFVAGLVLGFAIPAFPNPRMALTAHLNAVQCGTFLIALGLLWPRLSVWERAETPLSHVIWIAFWGLEAGLVLAAFIPPGLAGASPLKPAATALQALSSAAMLLSVGALLFAYRPPAHQAGKAVAEAASDLERPRPGE